MEADISVRKIKKKQGICRVFEQLPLIVTNQGKQNCAVKPRTHGLSSWTSSTSPGMGHTESSCPLIRWAGKGRSLLAVLLASTPQCPENQGKTGNVLQKGAKETRPLNAREAPGPDPETARGHCVRTGGAGGGLEFRGWCARALFQGRWVSWRGCTPHYLEQSVREGVSGTPRTSFVTFL